MDSAEERARELAVDHVKRAQYEAAYQWARECERAYRSATDQQESGHERGLNDAAAVLLPLVREVETLRGLLPDLRRFVADVHFHGVERSHAKDKLLARIDAALQRKGE